MKVLVVGSGGREHAICWAFSKSGKVSKVYCAEGNAGIATVAECVPIPQTDVQRLAEFAEAQSIDVTFVGGEVTLALGISDEFRRRGLKIIGPSQAAARLEGSKAFAKDFMSRHGVPTAKYATASSVEEAIGILESGEFGDENSPVVVKADGLAAGKGVVVAEDMAEAIEAVRGLSDVAGSAAASTIVLEERMTGREVSLLLFADGRNYALMPPVRDHKRIFEGDKGPNTGGMGTVSDRSLLSDADLFFIEEKIVKPTLAGCDSEGFPFAGVLFIGLMMTPQGPRVLEYNVRFGDPETQSILSLLKSDLVDVCEAIDAGGLDQASIEWSRESAACVILAARGYPASPQKGDVIYGLDIASKYDGVQVFHAGTSKDAHGNFITAGGRVLGVTATGNGLESALALAYEAVNDISWNGMQYRRDIGGT